MLAKSLATEYVLGMHLRVKATDEVDGRLMVYA